MKINEETWKEMKGKERTKKKKGTGRKREEKKGKQKGIKGKRKETIMEDEKNT